MLNDQDYMKLMEFLIRNYTWPTDYMFKFIIPFEVEKLNELKSLFSAEAAITHNESKSSKYISFTAVQHMDNPDDVVEIYSKASKIEKLISL